MKQLSSFLNLLIFSVCLVIGGAFAYLKFKPEPHTPVRTLTTEEMDALVNKHLQKTVQKNQLANAKNHIAITDVRQDLVEQQKERRFKEDKANEKIPLERQIGKDDSSTPSLSEVIKTPAVDDEDPNNMSAEEKKEYARKWIQNARKNGYLLELSPDLEVIKYVPIRKPSQQDDSADSDKSD